MSVVVELWQWLHVFEIDMAAGARRVQLDPVGTVTNLKAQRLDNCVRRIREGAVMRYVDVRRKTVIVHVSAGDTNRERAHLHSGSYYESIVDCIPQCHVRPVRSLRVDVSYRRKPSHECRASGSDSLDSSVRDRLVEYWIVARKVGRDRHVRMSIYHPGHQVLVAQVNDCCATWDRRVRTDGGNLVIRDDDDCILDDRLIEDVDHGASPNCGHILGRDTIRNAHAKSAAQNGKEEEWGHFVHNSTLQPVDSIFLIQ